MEVFVHVAGVNLLRENTNSAKITHKFSYGPLKDWFRNKYK
jgi:hypothetical protein